MPSLIEYLRLNEGFASFVEYLGVESTEPKFQIMKQFYEDTVSRALTFDSSAYTHPISAKVTNPSEIEQLFDAISYSKGSSIISMLQHWLDDRGMKNETTYFQRGLRRYLKEHQFANARKEDLWRAMEVEGIAAGWLNESSVETMMSTWTDQAGYVRVQCHQNNANI